MIVDTDENIGYLIHRDGGYTSFPVATGQKRVVRYIGRTYDARTPSRTWQALSQQIKGDRITFGKLGRFLRLSSIDVDEMEETPYGIHSHASIEKMLAREDRYRSMGCILVSEPVLNTIIATFDTNEQKMDVVTVNGLGEIVATEPLLRTVLELNTKKDL